VTTLHEGTKNEAGVRREVKLVDADVHPVIPAPLLLERLPARWRDHAERFGRRLTPHVGELYPRAANQGMRADAWGEGVYAYPGSDPALARRQLLDEYGVDFAVLNCADLFIVHEVPEFAAALARTMNDYLREEWLDVDERFAGAIVVPVDCPEVAVAEIERCAGDERWVQVLLPASTEEPMGSPKYRPVFAAAAAAGLPVAVHLGGYDPHRGTGWYSYYLEEHVGYSLAMESQLLNMVCDGLFDELPELKVVLSECGVTWKVSLGWALDRAWELLQETAPRLRRLPSEVIHDQVWFTTQPIEEPKDPAEFLQAIEHGRLADRLLFSTDYPHWDFDSPLQALPRALDDSLRRRIMAGNACELWRLPAGSGS
jgi:predicted TIM-barrel fold metal-dependent hydrolase